MNPYHYGQSSFNPPPNPYPNPYDAAAAYERGRQAGIAEERARWMAQPVGPAPSFLPYALPAPSVPAAARSHTPRGRGGLGGWGSSPCSSHHKLQRRKADWEALQQEREMRRQEDEERQNNRDEALETLVREQGETSRRLGGNKNNINSNKGSNFSILMHQILLVLLVLSSRYVANSTMRK